MAKTKPRSERRQRKASAPPTSLKSKVAGFFREILVVLGLVLVIQTFAFASFYVPTPSMEPNILVGDRIFVSKLHYGPRLPTTIGIPYTRLHIPGLEFPAVRLPGFSSVKRGDVVVFNFPPDEYPISKKEHYVKRAIGLPGDTLEVRRKQVYVNGTAYTYPDALQQHWIGYLREGAQPPWAKFRTMGAQVQPLSGGTQLLLLDMDDEEAGLVASWAEFDSVNAFVLPADAADPTLFPRNSAFNMHNYGPVYIPKRGDEIRLNAQSWPLYEDLVTRYEGRDARILQDGSVEVDGAPADRYVVEQDYYFVMGDNRDNSLDGRAWGFVPDNHLVGKAVVAYFSWDPERGMPRLGRTGKPIR